MPTNGSWLIFQLSSEVQELIRERALTEPEWEEHDLRRLAEELSLSELGAKLEAYPGVDTRPLISTVLPARVIELEEAARENWAAWRSDGLSPPWGVDGEIDLASESLTSYWILTGEPEELAELRAQLLGDDFSGVHGVRSVRIGRAERPSEGVLYGSSLTEPQGAPPIHDPLIDEQGYLEPAPRGIDALSAWAAGYTGTGMGFVDVERSWNFSHEDLRHLNLADPITNSNVTFDGRDCPHKHGTEVLGVVAAGGNTRGVRGIAHGLERVAVASWAPAQGSHSLLPNAIVEAIFHLRFGDVLLVEVQTGNGSLPVEVRRTCFLAIWLAVGFGIIVVEAAGNRRAGNLDELSTHDFPEWDGLIFLRRDDGSFTDSGAIMVSAAWEASGEYWPTSTTCFGSRIDCFAWGGRVWTTGSDAGPGPCDSRYESNFGGTSAASAIVAGAAILVQEMHERIHGRRLHPLEMRQVLSSPHLGTNPAVGAKIGVMPDLRRIHGAFTKGGWGPWDGQAKKPANAPEDWGMMV